MSDDDWAAESRKRQLLIRWETPIQITAKSIKRKDQATHPNSRRAKQLDRVALRDHKLASRKAERDRATGNKSEWQSFVSPKASSRCLCC